MIEMLPYISFAVLFVYWFALLRLVDIIMPKAVIRKFARLPIALLASASFYYILFNSNLHFFQEYLAIYLLYNLVFILVYQNSPILLFLCSSACVMFFVAFNGIFTAIYSMSMDGGIIVEDLALTGQQIIFCSALTSITLVCIILVDLVPRRFMNISMLTKKQDFILGFLAACFVAFLVYNLYVFVFLLPISNIYISLTEIITPLVILSIYMLVLISNILAASKSQYEEIIDNLSTQVEHDLLMRDKMLNDGLIAYEVNCETGKMREIFNKTASVINDETHYNDYIPAVARDYVHPDNMHSFLSHFSMNYLISIYKQGKKEFNIDYKRLVKDGYRWSTAHTTLWLDEETDVVKALVYVRDIDAVKSQQIALQFKAERDPLSGLFNKEMTQKLIEAQFTADGTGALIIIDVDNFKSINDTFGHAYGDMVICDVAKKITKTFRDNDIVGRIGGDEFLVYMKNTSNIEIITIKATQLCDAIRTTYTSNGEKVDVSSSIGISLYPADGETFQHLYKSADSALYESKFQGKDTFNFCHETITEDFEPMQTSDIDTFESYQDSFIENVSEYIFKILYSADDYLQALHTVIEFVAKYYNFDRGYIYTLNPLEHNYDHEWRSDVNISQYISKVKGRNTKQVSEIFENIEKSSMYIYRNIANAPTIYKEYLEKVDVISTLKLPIYFEGELAGFIGFDTCVEEMNLPKDELSKLANICTILATFFQMHYVKDRSSNHINVLESAMDLLDSYAYIVDKATYEVLYMNIKTSRLLTKHVEKVGRCYEDFFGNEEPCKMCPLARVTPAVEFVQSYVHNKNINAWCDLKGANLIWDDGREVGFVSGRETNNSTQAMEENLKFIHFE